MDNAARIRELNDAFRRSLTGDRIIMTADVDASPLPSRYVFWNASDHSATSIATTIRMGSTTSVASRSMVSNSS
jgi:hypothetical protein